MDREQVIQILETTPDTIRTLLRGIDPTLHRWQPEPDEWSANQIIGHLIDTDRYAFSDRIQLMVTEEEPEIPGVDVNALAAARNDNDDDAFILLTTLAEQRIEHVKLIQSLTDEQMARVGHYKKYGAFHVSDFVYEWAYHDCDHIQQILGNIKSATWPHFSAAMQNALAS